MIAFPNIIQYTNENIMDINHLTEYPWINAAYYRYIHTGEKNLIFDYDDKHYLASFTPLKKIGNSDWIIGAVAPKDDFIFALLKTTKYSIVIGLFILLISIFIVLNVISHVVKPMKKITEEIDKIKDFDLQDRPKIRSRIKEVGHIADALYAMKQGLRSFQKYVPASLVRDLVEAGEDVKIGSIKKPLAIVER